MSNRRADVALGLLFFATLIGLGLLTIVLSDFRFGEDRHEIEVFSNDVGFLRLGDPILVHGMNSGKVIAIERITDPHDLVCADGTFMRCTVRLLLQVQLDLRSYLHEDYIVLIEDRGVLGGKQVRVDTGSDDLPLVSPGLQLVARSLPSVLQSAGALIEENRVALGAAIDNLRDVTGAAAQGEGLLGRLLNDGELAGKVETLVANLEATSQDLADGKGTLGQLIGDDGLATQAREILADIDVVSDRLARGEGTIGRLLAEEQGYDSLLALLTDARDGVDDIRAVMTRLSEGEGTLGKLLTDDALHGQVSQMVDDLAAVSADLAAGTGTLGKLINDPGLYDDFQSTLASVSSGVSDLTEGEGLLAMLINDKDLADTFKRVVDQILGAVEDARETAPVTSLGSFLFGTF